MPHTTVVTFTEIDTGATSCVAPGTRVEVYLHGTARQPWPDPVADGPALRPVPSGKRALVRGVAAGFFTAARTGEAHLTSTRPSCAAPGCHPRVTFTVTIQVR